MRKLTMLAGLAAGATGYVLGTRAGRQRFEQIKHGAQDLAQNPKVRDVAHKAQEQVKHQAPVVKEKVAAATSAATSKLPGNHGSTNGDTNGAHVADPNATWPSDSVEPFPPDPVTRT